jgi:hypothetical protein
VINNYIMQLNHQMIMFILHCMERPFETVHFVELLSIQNIILVALFYMCLLMDLVKLILTHFFMVILKLLKAELVFSW